MYVIIFNCTYIILCIVVFSFMEDGMDSKAAAQWRQRADNSHHKYKHTIRRFIPATGYITTWGLSYHCSGKVTLVSCLNSAEVKSWSWFWYVPVWTTVLLMIHTSLHFISESDLSSLLFFMIVWSSVCVSGWFFGCVWGWVSGWLAGWVSGWVAGWMQSFNTLPYALSSTDPASPPGTTRNSLTMLKTIASSSAPADAIALSMHCYESDLQIDISLATDS